MPRWPDNAELLERNHDIPLTAIQIVNVLKIKFTFRYNKPLGSNQKEIQQNYINLSNISPLLLLELVIITNIWITLSWVYIFLQQSYKTKTKKIKEKLHIDIFLFGKSNQHWVSKYDNTPVTVYKNTNELYINSVTAWHILQKTNSLNKSEFKSFGLLWVTLSSNGN